MNLNIDVDRMLKSLEKENFHLLDDERLCQLAIEVRTALIVLRDEQAALPGAAEAVELFESYDKVLGAELETRGYRVADSATLLSADAEEIAEALIDLDFQTLLDWSDSLKNTAENNVEDAYMLSFVNEEIHRRTLELNGGMCS